MTTPNEHFHTPTHNVLHHLETSGSPVSAKARPLPPDKYKRAKAEFSHLMENDICRPSKSSWASPIHVVNKKNGEIRICGDYRRLNSQTKADKYPIPRILDFQYILPGKSIFTHLDLNRAYYHIPMAPSDIEKTAVITPFGLFEYTRMPFGLRNAAQTFQRFMDTIFRGIDFTFAYIDDILIASENIEQHQQHLRTIFKILENNNLRINLQKCTFGQTNI